MSSTTTEIRLALWRNGYCVLPVSSPHLPIIDAGKRPILRNWKRRARGADEWEIRRWEAYEKRMPNTGIHCYNVCAVDVDFDEPLLAEKLVITVKRVLGSDPLVRIGRWPHALLLYRCDTQIKTELLYFAHRIKGDAHVDVLGATTQFVAFGIHPSGDEYHWIGPSPVHVAVRDLSAMTQSDIRRLETAMIEVLSPHGYVLGEVRQAPILIHRIAAGAYRALEGFPRLQRCIEWTRPPFKKIVRRFEVRKG